MKNGRLLLFLAYALPAALGAQELFPLNEPASSVPRGVLGVRTWCESFHEQGTQRALGVVRLMYGATPRLSVMLTASGSNHHGRNLPPDLVTHTHVGNQTFYYTSPIRKGVIYPYRFNGVHGFAKYRVLTSDRQNEHFRMALTAEYSIIKQAHDEAEPNLLEDTRGWGGGLIATYLKNHFAVSLATGFIIPGAYSETVPEPGGGTQLLETKIRYGRAVKYNLSFGYLVYPKVYSGYEQSNWNVYLEFIGKSYEAAQVFQDGEPIEISTPALKAGHFVEIHPGIQRIIGSNLRVDISAGLAGINKSYVHFYPVYMLGIQRYFYPDKNRKKNQQVKPVP